MGTLSRRRFVLDAPAVFGGAVLSTARSTDVGAEGCEALAASTWRGDAPPWTLATTTCS
jgi:hypothetical protein